MQKILVLLFIIMTACSKNPPLITGGTVDVNLFMNVTDSAGHDLLDPAYQGSYNADSIKLYYLINGETQEVFDGRLDMPRNFRILKLNDSSKYVIQIGLNADESSALPVTYIQWKYNDMDTITATYNRSEGSIICTKVWYNGILKWEAYKTSRSIQIIK